MKVILPILNSKLGMPLYDQKEEKEVIFKNYIIYSSTLEECPKRHMMQKHLHLLMSLGSSGAGLGSMPFVLPSKRLPEPVKA